MRKVFKNILQGALIGSLLVPLLGAPAQAGEEANTGPGFNQDSPVVHSHTGVSGNNNIAPWRAVFIGDPSGQLQAGGTWQEDLARMLNTSEGLDGMPAQSMVQLLEGREWSRNEQNFTSFSDLISTTCRDATEGRPNARIIGFSAGLRMWRDDNGVEHVAPATSFVRASSQPVDSDFRTVLNQVRDTRTEPFLRSSEHTINWHQDVDMDEVVSVMNQGNEEAADDQWACHIIDPDSFVPHVSIVKRAVSESVRPGGVAEFAITITNDSNRVSANNIVVRDWLPDGVGTLLDGPTFPMGSLPPGEEGIPISVSVQVPDSIPDGITRICNMAEVTWQDMAVPTSPSEACVPLELPDLEVFVDVSPATASPGQSVTWTFRSGNVGQAPYDTSRIVHTLSGLLSGTARTDSPGGADPGQRHTIEPITRVVPPLPPGICSGRITLTSVGSLTVPEITLQNNTDDGTVTVESTTGDCAPRSQTEVHRYDQYSWAVYPITMTTTARVEFAANPDHYPINGRAEEETLFTQFHTVWQNYQSATRASVLAAARQDAMFNPASGRNSVDFEQDIIEVLEYGGVVNVSEVTRSAWIRFWRQEFVTRERHWQDPVFSSPEWNAPVYNPTRYQRFDWREVTPARGFWVRGTDGAPPATSGTPGVSSSWVIRDPQPACWDETRIPASGDSPAPAAGQSQGSDQFRPANDGANHGDCVWGATRGTREEVRHPDDMTCDSVGDGCTAAMVNRGDAHPNAGQLTGQVNTSENDASVTRAIRWEWSAGDAGNMLGEWVVPDSCADIAGSLGGATQGRARANNGIDGNRPYGCYSFQHPARCDFSLTTAERMMRPTNRSENNILGPAPTSDVAPGTTGTNRGPSAPGPQGCWSIRQGNDGNRVLGTTNIPGSAVITDSFSWATCQLSTSRDSDVLVQNGNNAVRRNPNLVANSTIHGCWTPGHSGLGGQEGVAENQCALSVATSDTSGNAGGSSQAAAPGNTTRPVGNQNATALTFATLTQARTHDFANMNGCWRINNGGGDGGSEAEIWSNLGNAYRSRRGNASLTRAPRFFAFPNGSGACRGQSSFDVGAGSTQASTNSTWNAPNPGQGWLRFPDGSITIGGLHGFADCPGTPTDPSQPRTHWPATEEFGPTHVTGIGGPAATNYNERGELQHGRWGVWNHISSTIRSGPNAAGRINLDEHTGFFQIMSMMCNQRGFNNIVSATNARAGEGRVPHGGTLRDGAPHPWNYVQVLTNTPFAGVAVSPARSGTGTNRNGGWPQNTWDWGNPVAHNGAQQGRGNPMWDTSDPEAFVQDCWRPVIQFDPHPEYQPWFRGGHPNRPEFMGSPINPDTMIRIASNDGSLHCTNDIVRRPPANRLVTGQAQPLLPSGWHPALEASGNALGGNPGDARPGYDVTGQFTRQARFGATDARHRVNTNDFKFFRDNNLNSLTIDTWYPRVQNVNNSHLDMLQLTLLDAHTTFPGMSPEMTPEMFGFSTNVDSLSGNRNTDPYEGEWMLQPNGTWLWSTNWTDRPTQEPDSVSRNLNVLNWQLGLNGVWSASDSREEGHHSRPTDIGSGLLGAWVLRSDGNWDWAGTFSPLGPAPAPVANVTEDIPVPAGARWTWDSGEPGPNNNAQWQHSGFPAGFDIPNPPTQNSATGWGYRNVPAGARLRIRYTLQESGDWVRETYHPDGRWDTGNHMTRANPPGTPAAPNRVAAGQCTQVNANLGQWRVWEHRWPTQLTNANAHTFPNPQQILTSNLPLVDGNSRLITTPVNSNLHQVGQNPNTSRDVNTVAVARTIVDLPSARTLTFNMRVDDLAQFYVNGNIVVPISYTTEGLPGPGNQLAVHHGTANMVVHTVYTVRINLPAGQSVIDVVWANQGGNTVDSNPGGFVFNNNIFAGITHWAPDSTFPVPQQTCVNPIGGTWVWDFSSPTWRWTHPQGVAAPNFGQTPGNIPNLPASGNIGGIFTYTLQSDGNWDGEWSWPNRVRRDNAPAPIREFIGNVGSRWQLTADGDWQPQPRGENPMPGSAPANVPEIVGEWRGVLMGDWTWHLAANILDPFSGRSPDQVPVHGRAVFRPGELVITGSWQIQPDGTWAWRGFPTDPPAAAPRSLAPRGGRSDSFLQDFGNFWAGYTRSNSAFNFQSHEVDEIHRQILNPGLNNGSEFALPLQSNTQNTFTTWNNGNTTLRPGGWRQGTNVFNNTVFAGASWASENYEPEVFNFRWEYNQDAMMRWGFNLPTQNVGFFTSDRNSPSGNGALPSTGPSSMANLARNGGRAVTFSTTWEMREMTQFSVAHCIAQFGTEGEDRIPINENFISPSGWSQGVRGGAFAWRDTPPLGNLRTHDFGVGSSIEELEASRHSLIVRFVRGVGQ